MIARHAAAAAEADFAVLALPHGDDRVIVAAVSGTPAAGLATRIAPLDTSLCGRAIRTGKPALIADYRDEDPAIAVSVATGPLLVVPLTAGEHIIGALALGRIADRPALTDMDLSMAASFATQAAVALELSIARDAHQSGARALDHERIAGDLHDHVIQELFALGLGLQGLASVTDRPAHVTRITGYIDSLDNVISAIRATIFQMQPSSTDGLISSIPDRSSPRPKKTSAAHPAALAAPSTTSSTPAATNTAAIATGRAEPLRDMMSTRAGNCTNAWPAATARRDRIFFSPRIGRSRALSRP